MSTLRCARRSLVLALPLALVACGGGNGDPLDHNNQGYQALSARDPQGALEHFAKAQAGLQPTDPEYKRALMGQVQAKVQVTPGAAKTTFLDFASAQSEQVEAGDYHKVGMLLSEGDLGLAIEVLHAGKTRFADDAKLGEAIAKMEELANQRGDTGALDSLRGLGYIGGD